MHDQRLAGVEIEQQIFGAPVDVQDAAACQALHEIPREWLAQIGAIELRPVANAGLPGPPPNPGARFQLQAVRAWMVYAKRVFR